jgi:hypothetical protein
MQLAGACSNHMGTPPSTFAPGEILTKVKYDVHDHTTHGNIFRPKNRE